MTFLEATLVTSKKFTTIINYKLTKLFNIEITGSKPVFMEGRGLNLLTVVS